MSRVDYSRLHQLYQYFMLHVFADFLFPNQLVSSILTRTLHVSQVSMNNSNLPTNRPINCWLEWTLHQTDISNALEVTKCKSQVYRWNVIIAPLPRDARDYKWKSRCYFALLSLEKSIFSFHLLTLHVSIFLDRSKSYKEANWCLTKMHSHLVLQWQVLPANWLVNCSCKYFISTRCLKHSIAFHGWLSWGSVNCTIIWFTVNSCKWKREAERK